MRGSLLASVCLAVSPGASSFLSFFSARLTVIPPKEHSLRRNKSLSCQPVNDHVFLGCAANSSVWAGGPRLPTGAEAEGDPSAGGSAAQSQRAGPPDGLGRPPQPVLQKQQQQGADRPLRRHRRSRGPAEGHGLGGDAETADRCTFSSGTSAGCGNVSDWWGRGWRHVHVCDNHESYLKVKLIAIGYN